MLELYLWNIFAQNFSGSMLLLSVNKLYKIGKGARGPFLLIVDMEMTNYTHTMSIITIYTIV